MIVVAVVSAITVLDNVSFKEKTGWLGGQKTEVTHSEWGRSRMKTN
jgi:hypothetical protein